MYEDLSICTLVEASKWFDVHLVSDWCPVTLANPELADEVRLEPLLTDAMLKSEPAPDTQVDEIESLDPDPDT